GAGPGAAVRIREGTGRGPRPAAREPAAGAHPRAVAARAVPQVAPPAPAARVLGVGRGAGGRGGTAPRRRGRRAAGAGEAVGSRVRAAGGRGEVPRLQGGGPRG